MSPNHEWFNEAKFGMLVCWGAHTVPGHDEWMLHDERVPVEDYLPYGDQFKPDNWDAREWVALAQEAGVRYMVLTARHHDGYSIFDSQLSDFTAPKTGPGRDLVAEYVAACREAGMRMGLYYSGVDWRFPAWEAGPESDEWPKFVEYVHGQVRELCTNYGPLDVLWFDGFGPGCAHCWKAEKLLAMIRELQPQCMVNDRLAGLPGDFDTPEQKIVSSEAGRPWESCYPIGHRWAFFRNQQYYKPTTQLLLHLLRTAAGGGNLLLSVGPDPQGHIPEPEQQILREIGQWLEPHGEAIYGTQPTKFGTHGTWVFGGTTTKGHTLYQHVLLWVGNSFCLAGLGNNVQRARLLTTGEEIEFDQQGDRIFFPTLPEEPPDPHMSVIALDLDGEPCHVRRTGSWSD